MRSKVIGVQLVVMLLLGAVIYLYVDRMLERYQTTEATQHLLQDAGLAKMLAEEKVQHLGNDSPSLAAQLKERVSSRVTIVGPDGSVLADSEVAKEELPRLDNHGNRPEVRDALVYGKGTAIRYSETLKMEMLYVALPFTSQTGEQGVIRLALPQSSLHEARSGFKTVLGVALPVALILVVFFSIVLARISTRSLHAISAIAARIGKGELGTRVPCGDDPEIAQLARALNEMADRTEKQLQLLGAEKNRLDTILRGMGEGLMVTDSHGEVTLVNRAFKDLFSIQEEVEGKQLIDISRHPALHDSFKEVVSSGQERVEELQLRGPKERTVFTHWVPLLEAGLINGVVAVFHDISDIRQMEKMRRDFVANVSHELRTPVTVIKGYAETLLAGALENPGQAAKFVGIIQAHSDRLATLVGDLLVLSQLESGTIVLESRKVSLGDIAEHVVALLEQKIAAKRIKVDISALGGAPDVIGDPVRLEQVLINLVDNAVKYTPAGGSVTLAATSEGDQVVCSVRDTGIGIPAKDLPRIFERFYRVDAARSRDEGGTGLGLSIVKHIVQLQGGSVSVKSSGQGSTFLVTLKKA